MKNQVYYLLIIILFMFSVSMSAQKDFGNSVKGNITEKGTNKPIQGAEVYFSQTSYFALTDAAGNFEIKNIIPGNYFMVITYKDFVPLGSNLYIEKGNKYPVNGAMDPLPADVKTKMNAPKPSNFDSDYMKFERIFIGQTAYMGSCKVENPEVMNFNWKDAVIEGQSNGAIVFTHKKFGYRIHCNINNFYYDTKQLNRGLDYSLYFEEMKPKDEDELDDWQDYRKEAYVGSIHHFLWAFRNEKLKDEDYEVFTLRSLGPDAMMSDGMDAASNAENQFQNKILSFSEISLGDVDDNQKMFTINGFLKVVYKPRSYSKETSFVQVPSQGSLTLDREGFTDVDMPFNFYGKWSRGGISNMLPKEYRAKQK